MPRIEPLMSCNPMSFSKQNQLRSCMRLLRAFSREVLNIFIYRSITLSLGTLFQCLAALCCSPFPFLLQGFPAEKIPVLEYKTKVNDSLSPGVSVCRRTKSMWNSEWVAAWTIPLSPLPCLQCWWTLASLLCTFICLTTSLLFSTCLALMARECHFFSIQRVISKQ